MIVAGPDGFVKNQYRKFNIKSEGITPGDDFAMAPESKLIVALARWPLMFLILLVALAILYRFAPSRDAPRWQWLSLGAVAAAILWIAGSALLSWYLSEFANYNATYGSLGAAIGLMTWMWMSAIVIMFARRIIGISGPASA